MMDHGDFHGSPESGERVVDGRGDARGKWVIVKRLHQQQFSCLTRGKR